MELTKALDQIAQIHDQMAKGEVYSGYRPVPVAVSGLCGFLAAGFQPLFVVPGDGAGFVRFWMVAAVVSGLVAGCVILYNYVVHEDSFARRRSRCVLGQFVPALVAGGLVTVALMQLQSAPVALLPGLWAVLYGLGIFASRPYLPRAAGWIALYYLVAGTVLLMNAGHPAGAAFWGVGLGIAFGIGQLASALMLHLNIERSFPFVEEN